MELCGRIHMCNMEKKSPISSDKKVMAKIKVFSKVGQTSRSR